MSGTVMSLIGAHINAPVNGTVMLLIGAHCNNCPRMNGTVMFLIEEYCSSNAPNRGAL